MHPSARGTRVQWLLLAALSFCGCARGDAPLADVPGQLKALAALATSLEAAGVDASRERSTLWTANFFEGAIGSDSSNASSLARVFSAWLGCTPANASCGDIAAALAAALPSLETASLQSVLADALAAGEAVLSAPSQRLPPRPLNASALALLDGYLRDATGAPALVTGFNDMDPVQLLPGSGAISALSLGLNDASISARWSGLDENGTVPASTIAGLVDQFRAAAAAGYTLEVFVGQGSGDLPSWLEDKFPGLTNCTNKFIGPSLLSICRPRRSLLSVLCAPTHAHGTSAPQRYTVSLSSPRDPCSSNSALGASALRRL